MNFTKRLGPSYYFNESFPKITVNKIKRKRLWISQPSKMKKENYYEFLNNYGEEKAILNEIFKKRKTDFKLNLA